MVKKKPKYIKEDIKKMSHIKLNIPFNVDPRTLNVNRKMSYATVNNLYYKYKDELITFLKEMSHIRKNMLKKSYSADFSDRESELLYLLIRETKPSVVVEISPCHGYSTNYILAALTANGKGKLHSYEICEKVNGIPIDKVIFSNLASSIDKSRLELIIGDATQAFIPIHDFLFIDSNHEIWFAAWYFSKIVNIPEIIFIHDILIRPKNIHYLLPKGFFLGIREQYYVLYSLYINGQFLFSVADFAHYINPELKAILPCRYDSDYTDRSIVFQGHIQNQLAMNIHNVIQDIHKSKIKAIIGDRIFAMETIKKYSQKYQPLFLRILLDSLLPLLGYRKKTFPEMFSEFEIQSKSLTVSEVIAGFELALLSNNYELFKQLIRSLRKSEINKKLSQYIIKYYTNIFLFPCIYNKFYNFLQKIFHKIK